MYYSHKSHDYTEKIIKDYKIDDIYYMLSIIVY